MDPRGYLVDPEKAVLSTSQTAFEGGVILAGPESSSRCASGGAENCAKKLQGASGSSSPRRSGWHRTHRRQHPSSGCAPTGVPPSDTRCWVLPPRAASSIAKAAAVSGLFAACPRAQLQSLHNRGRDNPCAGRMTPILMPVSMVARSIFSIPVSPSRCRQRVMLDGSIGTRC